jgi:uncharacterized iron-regulated membrane protein
VAGQSICEVLIEMNFKKVIAKIHLWLGLSSGLVVFILGLTGAIFSFETQLKYIFHPDRYYADYVTAKPLPLRVLKEKAQHAIGEDHPLSFVLYKPGTKETYRFRSSKFNAARLTYNSRVLFFKTVFINPFTGKVQYIENTKWEFFQTVLQIHNELMIGEIGHLVTAWGTLIFIIMLITGLVLWWPKSKAAAKQRFSIKWKAKWRRVNYDAHNVGGFYVFILALIIALTGLYFAFEFIRKPVKWLAGGDRIKKELPSLSDTSSTPLPNVLDLIEAKVARQPFNKGLYFVGLPENKLAPVVFTIMHNSDNYLSRSQYFFDKYTGAMLKNKPADQWDGAENFLNMIYDIHVGKVLGIWGQILACLGSLVSAALPVTGFVIWWGKKYKTRSRRHRT